MRDIIIHGGSSFLGKEFLRKLIPQKKPVFVLARETSDFSAIEKDSFVKIFRYKNSLSEINTSEIKVDSPVFFEFSWHGVFGSERNNPEQLSINIPLIISSINFAKKLNASHWIGIGSQAEYGNLNKVITENDECNPTTLYGKSKLICSKISEELCNAYGIEFSWLRLFSVYGPNDNHEWLIPYLIKEMLNNNEINVTKGEQMWDYLFIDDISEMLLKMVNAKGIGIANLGSGQYIEIKQLIEKIKKLTCSDSKINYGAIKYRPDQVMFMCANISKLANHLNWQPKTKIDDGLQKIIYSLKR